MHVFFFQAIATVKTKLHLNNMPYAIKEIESERERGRHEAPGRNRDKKLQQQQKQHLK